MLYCGAWIALRRGLAVPAHGLARRPSPRPRLRRTATAEIELRVHVALVGGLAVPVRRLAVVLRDAGARVVHQRRGCTAPVALPCSAALRYQRRRLGIVLGHALAFVVRRGRDWPAPLRGPGRRPCGTSPPPSASIAGTPSPSAYISPRLYCARRVALVGGLAVPGHRFLVVFGTPSPWSYMSARLYCADSVALFRRLAIPGHRRRVVERHAFAVVVAQREFELRLGVAVLRLPLDVVEARFRCRRGTRAGERERTGQDHRRSPGHYVSFLHCAPPVGNQTFSSGIRKMRGMQDTSARRPALPIPSAWHFARKPARLSARSRRRGRAFRASRNR